MNGLEFLQRVQKEPAYQAIPVIIISTEGKEEDTIRGLKMGAKGYVKKPFQASELHGLIEKITAALGAPGERPMSDFQVSPELLNIYLEDARGAPRGARPLPADPGARRARPERRRRGAGPPAHPEGQQRDDGLLRHQGLRPPPGGRVRAHRATAPSRSTARSSTGCSPGRAPCATRWSRRCREKAEVRDLAPEKAGPRGAPRGWRCSPLRPAGGARAPAPVAPRGRRQAPAAAGGARSQAPRRAADAAQYVGARARTWCAWTSPSSTTC